MANSIFLPPSRAADAVAAIAAAEKRKKGPIKWCNRCSRHHGSRVICRLYLRDRRTSKTNRLVKRWCH